MTATLAKNPTIITAAFCVAVMMSGCTGATQVSGVVMVPSGQPIEGVSITLAHSERLTKTVQSNSAGEYSIELADRCFIICAGGNPTLMAKSEGFMPAETYVSQLKKSTHDFVLTPSEAENDRPL